MTYQLRKSKFICLKFTAQNQAKNNNPIIGDHGGYKRQYEFILK